MAPRASRSRSNVEPPKKLKRKNVVSQKTPAKLQKPETSKASKAKKNPPVNAKPTHERTKAKPGRIQKASSTSREEENDGGEGNNEDEAESSEEETEEEREAKRRKLEREQRKLGSYVGDGGRYYTLTEDQRSHRRERVLGQGQLGYALDPGFSTIACLASSREGKRRVIQSARNIDIDIMRPIYQKHVSKPVTKKEKPSPKVRCTLTPPQALSAAVKAMTQAMQRANLAVACAYLQRVAKRWLVGAWLTWCYSVKATHAKYTVGDIVEVRFARKQRYFAARIIAVQRNGAAFSVRFAGGEEERQVRPDVLRSLPAEATPCLSLHVASDEEAKQMASSCCWQSALVHQLLEVTRDGQMRVRKVAVAAASSPVPTGKGAMTNSAMTNSAITNSAMLPVHDLLNPVPGSSKKPKGQQSTVFKGQQSSLFAEKPAVGGKSKGSPMKGSIVGSSGLEGGGMDGDATESAVPSTTKRNQLESLPCCHWCKKTDRAEAGNDGGDAGCSSSHSSSVLYTAARTLPFCRTPVAWSTSPESSTAVPSSTKRHKRVFLCAPCQRQQLYIAARITGQQKRAEDHELTVAEGGAPLRLPSSAQCMPLSLFNRLHHQSREGAGSLEVDANGKVWLGGKVVDKDGGLKNGDHGFNYGMPNHRRCGEMLPPLVSAVACCVLRLGAIMLAEQTSKVHQKKTGAAEDEESKPPARLHVLELGSGLGNVASQLALQLGTFASVDGVELRGPIVAMAQQYLRELKTHLSRGSVASAVGSILDSTDPTDDPTDLPKKKRTKTSQGGSNRSISRGSRGNSSGCRSESSRSSTMQCTIQRALPPYTSGLERLQFMERDLFEMDMSGANFVVANNFGFGDEMNDRLLHKLHQDLRVGAVVVTLRELLPAWTNSSRRRASRLQRDRLVRERERECVSV
jgi:hypothetical protein